MIMTPVWRPQRVFGAMLAVLLMLSSAGNAQALEAERNGIESVGVRLAYGQGNRHGLVFASLVPTLSMFLPPFFDRPLARYHLHASWVSEVIVSGITDGTSTVEVGVNPLFFSLRYDRGQALVPFIEGGEGLLYTDLRGERLGTRFQFSSQAGAGLQWFMRPRLALTLAYRLRHISNAGISRENSGLNTDFFMLGLVCFATR